ncbi:MAG: hypothetical protein HZC40_19095 [Chloroflexi bacterium]|nr:hypothetical protein [Chloroflexota bacterium]
MERILVLASLLIIAFATLAFSGPGAQTMDACTPVIQSDGDDWWVLQNRYGRYDLIVYSHQAVVFGLSSEMRQALKQAKHVELGRKVDGTYRLCGFK